MPISGCIGKFTVTEGALVSNGRAAALATVQQLDPMYADVIHQVEQQFTSYETGNGQRYFKAGKR